MTLTLSSVLDNMSAKFDEAVLSGLVSYAFTWSMRYTQTDGRTNGTTTVYLYPFCKALRGENKGNAKV